MSDMSRKEAIENLETLKAFLDVNGVFIVSDTVKKSIDFAISSLETDEAYQLEYESTTKNNLEVDCNNCKNNLHRGDGTSYCATGDGMCHYECEEPTAKNNLGVDAISRQALIDWLKNWTLGDNSPLIDFVNSMPAVTPIRPKGHWEHGKELCKEYQGRILVDVTYADWHCSNCNCNYVIKGTVKPKWNYCPNCGSDNREVEE